MTKLKKLIGLLLLFALACSFVGCKYSLAFTNSVEETEAIDTNPSSTTEQSATTDESEPPEEPDAPDVFLKSDVTNFRIVYASNLSAGMLTEVQKLEKRINSACGVTITVIDDLVADGEEQTEEWEHEILVGMTNREESAEFVRDFREGDYGYGYLNGKIVIGGGSDGVVKRAISMFLSEVISKHSSEDVFFQSDWTSLEKKTYNVERLTINGASIKDYEIVYTADSGLFEQEMATRLQSIVSEQMGYVLPINSDAEVETAGKAFLIGKTKFSTDLTNLSANEGCVVGNGTNVVAYGEDVQGVVNASKLLTNILFDSAVTEMVREITLGAVQKTTGDDKFSVMTHNLMVGEVPEDRIARTMTLIYKYMPDTLGVQEAKAEWMTALTANLSDYYAIVGEGREGGTKGEYTAILYAKAKYDLIESGTKWLSDTPDEVSKYPNSTYYRIFTWALLEDKETGVRYLHVNTHLDCDGARLEQAKCLMMFLKDYNDVAIVLTGDMNASLGTDEMKFIQEHGFATKTDFKDLDSLPLYGRGNNVVDWIFVTQDCMTLTNYITDNNFINGDYASDHCSYYAEFTVQYPTEGTLDHGWGDLNINLKPDGILDRTEDQEGSDFGQLIRPR